MKMVEKLQKRIQEGKKNNKGFSLVELIIVIAIMAILIGIVGMNVIPQIENARRSKDMQVLSAYLTEAMEAYTQNVSKLDTTKAYTIEININTSTHGVTFKFNNADVSSLSGGEKAFFESFQVLSGLDADSPSLQFESNAGSKITKIEIICRNQVDSTVAEAERHMVVVKITGPTGKEAIENLVSNDTLNP